MDDERSIRYSESVMVLAFNVDRASAHALAEAGVSWQEVEEALEKGVPTDWLADLLLPV